MVLVILIGIAVNPAVFLFFNGKIIAMTGGDFMLLCPVISLFSLISICGSFLFLSLLESGKAERNSIITRSEEKAFFCISSL